ncbi:MAG: hypothetical protein QM687_02120 [Ferruginibacter sp.]
MKKLILFVTGFCLLGKIHAQAMKSKSNNTTKQQASAPVPCNGDADALPGKYTDHTQPKYPTSIRNYSTQEKAVITKQLIALEKIEEASRKDFQLTGCVARVSFSGNDRTNYGGYIFASYGYQLGLYQNVCHVTEHVVKTVDEYRSVLRVNVNPWIPIGFLKPGGTGTFYLTDKNTSVRYEIPIDAKLGPSYDKDAKTRPSRISQYISEAILLTSRSSDYKNKHADFLKLINGDGYVENWMSGSKYDKITPKSYRWIDQHQFITRPGVPLLIPVSRKEYLEALLEYYEIEKANFLYAHEELVKSNANNSSEKAKKRAAILEADKAAYPAVYEAKKAKVNQLLNSQKQEWLQKPAVIGKRNDDGNNRLDEIGKFYDMEDENSTALYLVNPAYFKYGAAQPLKPVLFEIQYRYEISPDFSFSIKLYNNFLKNYDFKALQKMLE